MLDSIIDRLYETRDLPDEDLKRLFYASEDDAERLCRYAAMRRHERYGRFIYIRGLIEISNICKNNCYYCGLRSDNHAVQRYRLTPQEIYECTDEGYDLGFRTFVLQGGEDGYFNDERLCEIVRHIHTKYPDCAITLSVGERSFESYQKLFEAGANRYLLRHETANEAHYQKLHPACMRLSNRKQCLFDLKTIGYQVGSGFMVGSPYQTPDTLIEDLRFLQKLMPDMIGIGPFIPQSDTPLHAMPQGTLSMTINLIAILRLMFPHALLPSTTALGTIDPQGRLRGLAAGANVVMPNLSPMRFRKLYAIYDNKISTGEESAQSLERLKAQVESIGYTIAVTRGDVCL